MSDLLSAPESLLISTLLRVAKCTVEEIRSRDPCQCNLALSDIQLLSLYCYTTEDPNHSYKAINPQLSVASNRNADVQTQINAIDSALDGLRPFVGQCFRTEEENGRIHSKVLQLLARDALGIAATADEVVELFVEFFMSTSSNQFLLLRGKAIEIVIIGVIAGRDISHLSQFSGESEILFKRNTRFLILDVDQTPKSCLIYMGEI